MRTKAQSAVEFALIIGFLMLVFSAMVVIVTDKSIQLQQSTDYDALHQLGSVVKSELDFAGTTEQGYLRTIYLPSQLNGLDYNLTLIKGVDLGANYSVIVVSYKTLPIGQYIAFTYGNITPGSKLRIGGGNNITKGPDAVCINDPSCT